MNFLESLVTVIIVEVLALMVLMRYYQARQARALEKNVEVQEARFALYLRKSRGDLIAGDLPGGALEWLKEQVRQGVGLDIEFADSHLQTLIVHNLPVLALYTEDDGVLIVSPFSQKKLKSILKKQVKVGGKLGEYSVSAKVANMIKRPVWTTTRSLINAGNLFDLEATKAGDEVEIDWSNVDQLTFVMGKIVT